MNNFSSCPDQSGVFFVLILQSVRRKVFFAKFFVFEVAVVHGVVELDALDFGSEDFNDVVFEVVGHDCFAVACFFDDVKQVDLANSVNKLIDRLVHHFNY